MIAEIYEVNKNDQVMYANTRKPKQNKCKENKSKSIKVKPVQS